MLGLRDMKSPISSTAVVVVFSWGVQDEICHKVASCEGKTAAEISRDGYASITR